MKNIYKVYNLLMRMVDKRAKRLRTEQRVLESALKTNKDNTKELYEFKNKAGL